MNTGPVLLVDDEPVVLRIHAAAVKQFGFETIIAETAEEAVSLTRAYRPSLVISDVQMPGEGGFDFVEALDRSGLKAMPVIFLTGYDDIEIVRGGLKAGGDDFIIKGGSVERLRNRIAFWLASGFQELPSDLRRRALIAANAVKGDHFSKVEDHLTYSPALTQRVLKAVRAEMAPLGADFGVRLVERVCFLGRLSKLIIDECASFGDFVRFPDYIIAVINGLNPVWKREMWPLLGRFEDWACDMRFVYAGVEPLKPFREYEWFVEGLER
ncbi:response regulator [Kordiimonas marina]|uniref:response regulator n=1 Tax=Kordiimonas marina TaxID=2872312 RepID=UPI001FF3DB43|nr:response regulator [Kordiimonas marina]MCJ9429250.1 response regulator [Kordiimonas marina]